MVPLRWSFGTVFGGIGGYKQGAPLELADSGPRRVEAGSLLIQSFAITLSCENPNGFAGLFPKAHIYQQAARRAQIWEPWGAANNQ